MRSRLRRRMDKVGFTVRKKRNNTYYAHPEERAKEIISNSELRDYISENRPDSL